MKILGTVSFGTGTAPAKQELPIYLLLKMLKMDHRQKWITDNWQASLHAAQPSTEAMVDYKRPPHLFFRVHILKFQEIVALYIQSCHILCSLSIYEEHKI